MKASLYYCPKCGAPMRVTGLTPSVIRGRWVGVDCTVCNYRTPEWEAHDEKA